MILQNIVFPDEVCPEREMYFRTEGNVQLNKDFIHMFRDSSVATNTYMNAFNLEAWYEDTNIEKSYLTIIFRGKGILHLMHRNSCGDEVTVSKQEIESEELQLYTIKIPSYLQNGACYWKIYAIDESIVQKGTYFTKTLPSQLDICLAVNICTYHREKQLEKNLNKLQKSEFFQEKSELNNRMHVFVVDNGNSLKINIPYKNMHLFFNSNHGGGSGGFARGLEEIGKMQESNLFSHVVFMDDDVEFQIESFYRLFAYLSYLKKEKKMTSVAGRMFRLDQKNIQYTAVEIWNGGNIQHVDGSQDMKLLKNGITTAMPIGDYGGWWFCTYPVEFALNNKPFPFFIHCDDVEYGLRFPGRVIALQGVQVWHETYEYRVTPQIIYYDIRNPMVVNTLHRSKNNTNTGIIVWYEYLERFHKEGNQTLKYLCILAMYHFLKGYRFFKMGGKLPEIHDWIKDQTGILKIVNPIFYRYVLLMLKTRKDLTNILRGYPHEKGETTWLLK